MATSQLKKVYDSETLEGKTLRDFMRDISAEIYHVAVNTPDILRDMDTPDEYQRELADYARRRQSEPAFSL